MVVRTHMDYLFPIENENVLLSKRCTHFILPSELWISFHNVAYCPILDKYENQMIRISLHTSHFLQKRAASSSEPLIYFKYNNHIQDRKMYSRNEMRWWWPDKRINLAAHLEVFLNLVGHCHEI